jgi:hypothetical protein
MLAFYDIFQTTFCKLLHIRRTLNYFQNDYQLIASFLQSDFNNLHTRSIFYLQLIIKF